MVQPVFFFFHADQKSNIQSPYFQKIVFSSLLCDKVQNHCSYFTMEDNLGTVTLSVKGKKAYRFRTAAWFLKKKKKGSNLHGFSNF